MKGYLNNEAMELLYVMLWDAGYVIQDDRKIDYGLQLMLSSGAKVNIYQTGRFAITGKKDNRLKNMMFDWFNKSRQLSKSRGYNS